MTALNCIIGVQVLTYVAAAPIFLAQGNWRYSAAQLLLALVQGLIYFS